MNSNLQSAVDINSGIRSIFLSALDTIPVLGWLISPLVGFIWPTGQKALWNQIAQDAENQLQGLNQKIDQQALAAAQAAVEGLQNVMNTYVNAVATGDQTASVLQTYYLDATTALQQALPQLQLSGYQTLLLPLYAQAVNLGVALYRDGATPATAATLGFSPGDITDQTNALNALVKAAIAYVNQWIPAGSTQVYNYEESQLNTKDNNKNGGYPPGPGNYAGNSLWNAVNQYNRYMTLAVSDFAFMWNYMQDPAPAGPMPPNTREIYSDAMGCLYCYPPGSNRSYVSPPNGPLTSASNLALISNISIWGESYLASVQQDFGSTSGPRRGMNGGNNTPADGYNGPVSATNPIAGVAVYAEGWVFNMQLQFQDGTMSNLCGGPSGGPTSWNFQDEVVSQIYIETVAQGAYAQPEANCAIIGFRLADSYAPPPASSTT